MKLSNLTIKKHAHLNNLKLDFKYTSGEKKGEVLNKICFVGQSGTGKTTILNLIQTAFESFSDHVIDPNRIPSLKNINNEINAICDIELEGFNFTYRDDNSIEYLNTASFEDVRVKTKSLKLLLLYITAELFSETNDILNNKIDLPNSNRILTSEPQIDSYKLWNDLNNIKKYYDLHKVLALSSEVNQLLWYFLVMDIIRYDEKLKQKGAEIIHKGFHSNPNRINSELEKWRVDNPNPRALIADKILNPILDKFQLEVEIDDISAPIVIKQKNGSAIPGWALSTGTKQYILSSLALNQAADKGTIILIDEPERSLFPDIQMELISHYTSFLPDNQFIISTHSPMIAAAFEPEERFLFSFDNDGNVQIKRGEAPLGDDPNDLLRKDFNITSVMNKDGISMYRKYLQIKSQIEAEENIEIRNKLILEAAKIANDYNF